jgi:hypothetical protein
MSKSNEPNSDKVKLLLKLEDQVRAIKHLWLLYGYNDDRTAKYLNGMYTILDEIDKLELKDDKT